MTVWCADTYDGRWNPVHAERCDGMFCGCPCHVPGRVAKFGESLYPRADGHYPVGVL